MKVGLALEGGALSGVFTAGVLDCLLDEGIEFQYVGAVSSGSNNALGFVSKQKGRARQVINPPQNDSYHGWRTVVKKGKLMDLDKMFFQYPIKQYPFDFSAFFKSPVECEFVLTECESGEVVYASERSDKKRLMLICKATCALPMLTKPVELDGKHYMDGSVTDAVPFDRAFEKGCDKVVVVLAKSDSDHHTDYGKYRSVLKLLYGKKYPKFVETMLGRHDAYGEMRERLAQLEREGKVFVIKPTLPCISKTETDNEKIDSYYYHGKDIMNEKLNSLKEFMNENSGAERKSQSGEQQHSASDKSVLEGIS